MFTPPPNHKRFTALFPGPPGWAGARRELLDFMVQGKNSRGRFTDHPAGCHSRLTSAHLHHPPIFLETGCPSCCPTNSVKALRVHFVVGHFYRHKIWTGLKSRACEQSGSGHFASSWLRLVVRIPGVCSDQLTVLIEVLYRSISQVMTVLINHMFAWYREYM